jgi:hypothetical protein
MRRVESVLIYTVEIIKKVILVVIALFRFVFRIAEIVYQVFLLPPRYFIYVMRRSEMRRVAEEFRFTFLDPEFVWFTNPVGGREAIYIDESLGDNLSVKVFDRYYPEEDGDRPVKTYVVVNGKVLNNEADFPSSYSYFSAGTVIGLIKGALQKESSQ